jgi:SAM-dependent methyltransferase
MPPPPQDVSEGVFAVCRLCGAEGPELLLDFGSHPIAHQFLTAPSADEYVHPVKLAHCNACGHLQLVDPVPPERLYTEYVCLSSWKRHPHEPMLLDLLSEVELDRDARILEIGSNDGVFLEGLRRRGFSWLLGVEPARDAWEAARARDLETLNTFFNEETAAAIVDQHGQQDLVVFRHVLEHIEDLSGFAAGLRRALKPNGLMLIEVPDFDFCLDVRDYSGIWEEHVNYFTRDTLLSFIERCGVGVFETRHALFSGQAQIMLGRGSGRGSALLARDASSVDELLAARVRRFQSAWPTFQQRFHEFLQTEREAGRSVAVYGAGCRSCSLINFTGLGSYLECVFDDQPEKNGLFMPGSRLEILPGEELERRSIDTCLLAVNAENEQTVIDKHSEFIEHGGRFVSVLPPSELLPEFWSGESL